MAVVSWVKFAAGGLGGGRGEGFEKILKIFNVESTIVTQTVRRLAVSRRTKEQGDRKFLPSIPPFFTLANDDHFCFMKNRDGKTSGRVFLPALSTIPSGTLLDPVWLLNIFHHRKTGLFYTELSPCFQTSNLGF